MQILDGHLILSATDLVGHLACTHLTVLEREAAEGNRTRPMRLDPALDVLAKRGREREEKFLDEARGAGRRIVEFPGEPLGGVEALRAADRLTLEAMRAGAEVIAQASFFDGRWQGRADFLLRVERPSGPFGWGYELAGPSALPVRGPGPAAPGDGAGADRGGHRRWAVAPLSAGRL